MRLPLELRSVWPTWRIQKYTTSTGRRFSCCEIHKLDTNALSATIIMVR